MERSTTSISLDLGLTTTEVTLTPDRLILPDAVVTWPEIEEIAQHETACFIVEDNRVKQIRGFSEFTGRAYGLMPTASAPTMLISGLPMHRIKNTNPYQDTLAKIKAIAPIHGRVLDTCTGLGYTAIEAAKTAERVITIELDPTAQEMARFNPWSRSLFDNPKIEQIIGDTFDEIQNFEDGVFSCIIHDPPMLSLAGDLYSGDFYAECLSRAAAQRPAVSLHRRSGQQERGAHHQRRGAAFAGSGLHAGRAQAASVWRRRVQMIGHGRLSANTPIISL